MNALARSLQCLPGKSLLFVTLLTCLSASVQSEDLKVVQLEQDVRELQREVQMQARRIETLERELAQPRLSAGIGSRSNNGNSRAAPNDLNAAWLNIASWDRVRQGSSELDVLAALGPPTGVRKSNDGARQSLLYSLEIAAGGFLTGQVVLADHKVVEVQKPALK